MSNTLFHNICSGSVHAIGLGFLFNKRNSLGFYFRNNTLISAICLMAGIN